MAKKQTRAFVEEEADAWFERNRSNIDSYQPEDDPLLALLSMAEVQAESVLDIGCANGFRLKAIGDRLGIEKLVGIEPSQRALLNGRKRFSELNLVRGTSDALPVEQTFDLVVVNFVLHWVDRRSLLKTVAEIDRVISDEGYLLLGDFLPQNQISVEYHHRPNEEMQTYKQDYSQVFLASGLYHEEALRTEVDPLNPGAPKDDDRLGFRLLKKQTTAHYLQREAD